MNLCSARNYYYKYVEENPGISTPNHITCRTPCTQEQIKEVVIYIVDDKMSISAASRKANICRDTARNHYHQYLKDNNIELSVPRTN
jgi:predicted transcriptional regulator